MENGQVTQNGTYNELLTAGTAFEQLVNAHESSMMTLNQGTRDQKQRTVVLDDHPAIDLSQPVKHNSEGDISIKEQSAVQLTEEEEKEIGNVGWKPYKDYFEVSKGYPLLALVILTQSAFVVLQSLSTYWLAIAIQMFHVGYGILVSVYAAVSFLSCFFAFLRSWIAALLGLRASKELFSGFMDSVFKAPMAFFDSTPIGRILTRVKFSVLIYISDQYTTEFPGG